MSLATLSVWQPHDSCVLRNILSDCRTLTYNAMEYAETHGLKNRKQMNGYFRSIRDSGLPSSFKVALVTRACTVLRSRRKSKKRGVQERHQKPLKLAACIITGFFVTAKGKLFISLGCDRFEMVQLKNYLFNKISAPNARMRSLTITENKIAICYSIEVEATEIIRVFGVDRNEKNLTFGSREGVEQINVSKLVNVKQMTREVISSFKRNDVRIRRRLAQKYWRRAKHRTDQILHHATNQIVERARSSGAALAVEDIKGINNLYRRGNGKGPDYRFRMNTWPHRKAYEMLEYKSAVKGITVIKLTKSETRGSSTTHSACGEKLRHPTKGDLKHRRQLWCETCGVWVDRDDNGAINLADRGLARLASSLPSSRERAKGSADEAVIGNPRSTVIPGADARQADSRPRVEEPRSPNIDYKSVGFILST